MRTKLIIYTNNRVSHFFKMAILRLWRFFKLSEMVFLGQISNIRWVFRGILMARTSHQDLAVFAILAVFKIFIFGRNIDEKFLEKILKNFSKNYQFFGANRIFPDFSRSKYSKNGLTHGFEPKSRYPNICFGISSERCCWHRKIPNFLKNFFRFF